MVELTEDAAKADPAIAAQLTTALQAMADTDPQDAPYARLVPVTPKNPAVPAEAPAALRRS